MVKKTIPNLMLKPFLLLMLLFMSTATFAYDFEKNGLYYDITSDSTVAVVGCSDLYYYDFDYYNFESSIDVEIPNQIQYENVEYIVTAIGDSAFYAGLEETTVIDHVIIPETVTSIGRAAFQSSAMTFVKCLASVPPTLNDSFSGDFILLVKEDDYNNYISNDEYKQAFNRILCFDGPTSCSPICDLFGYGGYSEYVYRAFMLVFDNLTDNTEIYGRLDCFTAIEEYGWFPWVCLEDNIYMLDSSDGIWDWWHPHHLVFEAYAIVDGMYYFTINIENENGGGEFGDDISLANIFTYDLIDGEIFYKFCGSPLDSSLYVTYEGDNVLKESYPNYKGDIVVPSTIHFAKWDYKVEGIGWYAFSNCENLISVTLPKTMKYIDSWSFTNCPNLIKLTFLGSVPPVGDEYGDPEFSEQNYENVTLYVPMSAVDAYRNAPIWGNFQHIVGFYDYDFEQDGLYFKKTEDGEVVVTCGENPYSGNVTIPATVTEQGVTYSVTGIGDGAFAGAEIDALYLPVTITTIGEGAFAESHIHSLYITGSGAWSASGLGIGVDNLYVGSGVNGMAGMQVSASVIYSYATVPPACDDQTFTDYNAELHVPATSVAAYFTAAYWCNFIDITGDAVELTSITLNDVNVEVLVGGQATLTATLNPTNAMPDSIIWESSNEAVATVDAGMVTGIASGECDIVAICQNKRATCHVTVTEILPTSITLNQETAKLEVGSQLALTATLQPDDVTMTTVSWATTDSTVAMVAGGVVIAVGAGECTITATCGELQAQCHIIVVEHLIYITLDEHEATVVPNHIITLTPTVTPVSTDLVVTSSNPSVAAARMANGKVQVVGISEGETVIRLQSADGYAEPDSCYVIVYTEVGDVNRDGFVNLADVVGLINYLLQGNDGQYSFENADVNHDNGVNVGDLSLLISYLLGGVDLEPNDPVNPSRSFTVNGVTFKMMRVTGGTFQMGATAEMDSDAGADESPVHDVTLSTYYMGQTEVTQELWQAVMGTNPSYYTGDLQRPVDKVSYSDCEAFIAQLNELTGQNFRLPSEAEWEFAARGGNRSHHYLYSGSNDATEVAWCTTTSDGTTHPVATKRPNELGIYDMSGNVCEWCGEWYSLYPEEPQVDPTGPETGRSRVHRGGSLQFLEKNCTVTRRNYFSPGIVRSYMGLRLVL